MLVQEGVIHRDMLGKGCFGPLCSLSLLVWFSHESTSKSRNQKKKRGRMDLAVRSPSWLEMQIHPDFTTAFPVLISELDIQSGLCVFAPWSECCARQTLTCCWKYKVTMSLEQWFTTLLLSYFSSTESCSCVTSLKLLLCYFSPSHIIIPLFTSHHTCIWEFFWCQLSHLLPEGSSCPCSIGCALAIGRQ